MIISSCGPRFSTRDRANNSTLHWAVPSDITTLDPALATDGRTLDYLRQIFEGLVAIDGKGRVVPCLAKSWDIDPTRTRYTFHLVPNVKFSNGRPLTADVVKFNFDRSASPSFSSSLVPFYLGDIVGLKEAVAGVNKSVIGVSVVDSLTVQIRIVRPKRSFLCKLAYPVSSIVWSDPKLGVKPISHVSEMIGTGPFKAASFFMPGRLILDRNETYRGRAAGVAHIEISVVKDPSTRFNMFGAGTTQLTQIQDQDVHAARGSSMLRSQLHLTEKADLTYLQFNSQTRHELADIRVRRALAMAIDRNWLAAKVMDGIPAVATGIVPSVLPSFRHINSTLPFDPKTAQKLLAEAGFPGGLGFPTIEVAYLDQQRDHPAVDAIVTMWRRYLGIHASARPYLAATLLDKNLHHLLPCFYTGWTGDYPDPEDYLSSLFQSSSPANGSCFSSKSIDLALELADQEPNDRKRGDEYSNIEQSILNQAPVVPLFFVRMPEMCSSRISGLAFTPFGHLSMDKVEFTAAG